MVKKQPVKRSVVFKTDSTAVTATLNELENVNKLSADAPAHQKKFLRPEEPGYKVVKYPVEVPDTYVFGRRKNKPEDMVHSDDVLKPIQRSKILQESIEAREQVYHSSKNPVGGSRSNDIKKLPDKFQREDVVFGKPLVAPDHDTKRIIYPDEKDVPKDLDAEERSRRDLVTHAVPPVGVQKKFGMEFPNGDPYSVTMGRRDKDHVSDNWSGVGVATTLHSEKDELRKTVLMTKKSADHAAFALPEVGVKTPNPFLAKTPFDDDHVYGKDPAPPDAWTVKDSVTGLRPDPKNEMARRPPKWLGAPKASVNPEAVSTIPNDVHAEYAMKSETFGMPSQIKNKKVRNKSIANMHSYGEEVTAKDLVNPVNPAMNVDSDIDPPMTEEEIKKDLSALDLNLTDEEIHLVYIATEEFEGKKGNKVTLERFRRQIFPVLYKRAGGLA